MILRGNLGESCFMGCSHWNPNPSLKDAFNQIWAQPSGQFASRLRDAALYMLAGSSGKFFVIQGSAWESILAEPIATGKVALVDFSAGTRQMAKPKHFLFLDNEEDSLGLGRDIVATFGGFVPNIILMRHVHALSMHLQHFGQIASAVRKTALDKNIRFTMVGIGSYDNAIFADLLYVLVDEIETVVKDIMHPGRLSHIRDTSVPLDEPRSYLIWNAGGTAPSVRRFMTKYAHNNFFFIHGQPEKRSNSCFIHNFVAVPLMPGHGCTRVLPMLSRIFAHLGISFTETGLSGQIESLHRELRLADDDNTLTELEVRGRIRTAIETAHNNHTWSWISIRHCNEWMLDELFSSRFVDFLVPHRDLRDVFISLMNAENASDLRYAEMDFRNLLVRQLKKCPRILAHRTAPYKEKYEDHNDTALVKFAATVPVLMRFRECPNAAFIRFEKTYDDPVGAYGEAFRKLGYDSDPFWLEPEISRLIATWSNDIPTGYRSQAQAIPELPRVIHGRPGAWKTCFSPEIVKLFKESTLDCGYLRAFGYETDDTW